MTSIEAGWYEDPEDARAQRYWDGAGWTPHRQRKAAVQPTNSSAPPPPPAPPPPSGPPLPPAPPPWPGSGGLQAENLAAAAGLARRMSGTAWIIAAGLLAATIGIFLTWETITIAFLGISETRGTSSGGKFLLLTPIVASAWLAWPVFAGTPMPQPRLIALTAIVGLMVLGIPVWLLAFRDNDPASGTTSFWGFGLLLYSAAILAVAFGVVRLWLPGANLAKYLR